MKYSGRHLKRETKRERERTPLLIEQGKVFKKSFSIYNFNRYHDFQVTLTIVITILIDVTPLL